MNRFVMTVGTFDTPHIGHANLLRQCETFGDTIVIGLNTDEFIERYKGKKPLFSYQEREDMLRALGYSIVRNNGAGRECIIEVKPDVLVIGSDWLKKDYLKQIDMTADEIDDYNITLVYVPYFDGISSTEIKKRLS